MKDRFRCVSTIMYMDMKATLIPRLPSSERRFCNFFSHCGTESALSLSKRRAWLMKQQYTMPGLFISFKLT